MLEKFKVKNFKNFDDWFEFDLRRPKAYEFNTGCVKNNLINKAIIYGENGVGKSNLGFAIFDLISHLTDRNVASFPYKHFLHAGTKCKLAEFQYDFSFSSGKVSYLYGKTDRESLVYEKLFINDREVAAIDRRISSVSEIRLTGAESLKSDMGGSKISLVSYIKKNTVLDENNENKCLFDFVDFVHSMLFFRSLDNNEYIGYEQGTSSLVDDVISKDKISDFQSFLNRAGIECSLAVMDVNGQKDLCFDFNGDRIRFLDIASNGTRALMLFYYWYRRILDGSSIKFLFIDEFDAFYHPKLSKMLVKMLIAVWPQVVITTHNSSVMTNELMRPDCYFVMKRDRMYPLTEGTDKELRETHNIEKMYKAGVFDG